MQASLQVSDTFSAALQPYAAICSTCPILPAPLATAYHDDHNFTPRSCSLCPTIQ
jgi:hypothetical protein